MHNVLYDQKISSFPDLKMNVVLMSTDRITLRLPRNLLNVLRKESEERDLPLNALINRILDKSVLKEGRINVLPTISVSNMLFEKILEKLDKVTIDEVSKIGPTVTRKYFTLLNQDYTIDNLITDYFMILSKYCGWYKFHHEKINNVYRLVFETPLGSKWTKFLASYVKAILLSFRVHIDEESIEDNIIIFEFRKI